MKRNLKELISQMTLEEKAGMCSGLDFWHLKGVERLGIPSVMVSDGPHGLRKQDQEADHLGINESIKAVCFPPAVLSACSFDRALLERLGETVGDEAQATDLSVVLGPAVNIKRSPLCGRNFEYYSEDPYLAGESAAAFIGGFVKNPRYQGGGSSHVNSFKVTSVWDALEGKEHVTYAEGFSADKDVYDEKLAAEAIEIAKQADKAVIFAGLPESFESEGYDRKHMHLPKCQNKLIAENAKVQPNIIVVLHNGSAVEMPWVNDVKGLVEAYLGGQAVGQAEANILYGNVNPSGKLAETLPIRLEDNPSYLNFGDGDKVEYNEGVFVGYRYYDKKKMEVAFPFGYGLSYTTFEYSNVKTDKDTLTEGETLQVSVDVTNTGDKFGKKIVQLYVADKTEAIRRPEKELKGFEKVALNPGETKRVTFTLDKRSFAWYSTDIHDWYAASGTYEILIAASSRDIRLTKTIQWESAQMLPLHLHLNTTLGELLSDERTKALGKELKGKMDSFFGGLDGEANEQTEGDEAVSDDMGDAIAASMPIRNVLSFGLCDKEELLKRLEELNKR